MKHARIAFFLLLALSSIVSIFLFVQLSVLNAEIDKYGQMIYGTNQAAIWAAEARMEKSAAEQALMVVLPIGLLAFFGLMITYRKYHVVGVIIVLAFTTFSCTDELHTTRVQYFGCDIADKTYTNTWTLEDVRERMFFENPTFCDSIIVIVDDSLAYRQTRM